MLNQQVSDLFFSVQVETSLSDSGLENNSYVRSLFQTASCLYEELGNTVNNNAYFGITPPIETPYLYVSENDVGERRVEVVNRTLINDCSIIANDKEISLVIFTREGKMDVTVSKVSTEEKPEYFGFVTTTSTREKDKICNPIDRQTADLICYYLLRVSEVLKNPANYSLMIISRKGNIAFKV